MPEFVLSKLKPASLVVCFLVLAMLLSACSAVGISKPAALQITTKPEAAVFLDGKHIGKTPFFSDQLKSGEHSLKITVSEASFADQISLTPGTLTVINRDLAPIFLSQAGETLSLVPDRKGLLVTSMPQQATISIDGKLAGKTPVLASDIPEGDHKLSVTKDGYPSREFAVKISSQYQLRTEVTLASIAAKDSGSDASQAAPIQAQKVEITPTPQGFLRVRQSASVNSPEIGRVKDGDQMEVIQESPGWIQIKFQGQQGWISADYTKKLGPT